MPALKQVNRPDTIKSIVRTKVQLTIDTSQPNAPTQELADKLDAIFLRHHATFMKCKGTSLEGYSRNFNAAINAAIVRQGTWTVENAAALIRRCKQLRWHRRNETRIPTKTTYTREQQAQIRHELRKDITNTIVQASQIATSNGSDLPPAELAPYLFRLRRSWYEPHKSMMTGQAAGCLFRVALQDIMIQANFTIQNRNAVLAALREVTYSKRLDRKEAV